MRLNDAKRYLREVHYFDRHDMGGIPYIVDGKPADYDSPEGTTKRIYDLEDRAAQDRERETDRHSNIIKAGVATAIGGAGVIAAKKLKHYLAKKRCAKIIDPRRRQECLNDLI